MITYTAKMIVVGMGLFLVPAIPTAMSQPVTRQDFMALRNDIIENFDRQNARIRRVEREIEDIRGGYGRPHPPPPPPRRIVHVYRYYEYYWCPPPPPPPWWW
jgi:hypothetical protein